MHKNASDYWYVLGKQLQSFNAEHCYQKSYLKFCFTLSKPWIFGHLDNLDIPLIFGFNSHIIADFLIRVNKLSDCKAILPYKSQSPTYRYLKLIVLFTSSNILIWWKANFSYMGQETISNLPTFSSKISQRLGQRLLYYFI